jgi:hypothetical protein
MSSILQPPYILIENYVNIYDILNHIENNYRIILTEDKYLNNMLIIDFNYNMLSYFTNVSKKYNGNIIKNFPIDNDKKYSIVLYDVSILEYLTTFYSTINYNVKKDLYNKFIMLYNNQSNYLDKLVNERLFLI